MNTTQKNIKRSVKRSLFIVLIVLSAIGLAFIGTSIGLSIKYKQIQNDYIETVAVLSTVDHNDERAYVKYTPIGETTEIEAKLKSYSSSYYEGKALNIYYNPNNFQDVYNPKELKIVILIFLIIGIVQLLFGFTPLIVFASAQARGNYYKTHFKKERANVIGIKTNYSISIGNSHPYTVTYKTKDGKYLKTTDYSSRFTNYEEGLVIDVYKNDKNGKYYADPESIRKEEIIEEDIFSIDNDKF